MPRKKHNNEDSMADIVLTQLEDRHTTVGKSE